MCFNQIAWTLFPVLLRLSAEPPGPCPPNSTKPTSMLINSTSLTALLPRAGQWLDISLGSKAPVAWRLREVRSCLNATEPDVVVCSLRPDCATMDRPTKITFGAMREIGVRGIVVYCQDYKCSHSQTQRRQVAR